MHTVFVVGICMILFVGVAIFGYATWDLIDEIRVNYESKNEKGPINKKKLNRFQSSITRSTCLECNQERGLIEITSQSGYKSALFCLSCLQITPYAELIETHADFICSQARKSKLYYLQFSRWYINVQDIYKYSNAGGE